MKSQVATVVKLEGWYYISLPQRLSAPFHSYMSHLRYAGPFVVQAGSKR